MEHRQLLSILDTVDTEFENPKDVLYLSLIQETVHCRDCLFEPGNGLASDGSKAQERTSRTLTTS